MAVAQLLSCADDANVATAVPGRRGRSGPVKPLPSRNSSHLPHRCDRHEVGLEHQQDQTTEELIARLASVGRAQITF